MASTGHNCKSSKARRLGSVGSTVKVYIFFLRKFNPLRTNTEVGKSYCSLMIPSTRLATALLAVTKRTPTRPCMPSKMDPPIRNKQEASTLDAHASSVLNWHNSFFTSSANDIASPFLFLLENRASRGSTFILNDLLVVSNILKCAAQYRSARHKLHP